MKFRHFLWFISLLSTMSVFLTACSRSKGDSSGKPSNVAYYTCTMHPSVRSQDPHGKCPICSMDLVPVFKKDVQAASTNEIGNAGTMAMSSTNNNEAAETPGEFTVPVERQQQIGVTYGAVEKRPFIHTVRVVGTVAYDKERHWDYVARVAGYVKQLSVFSRGQLV